VPVYRSQLAPKTITARRSELRGYAVGVFSLGDLVTGALRGLGVTNVEARLYDDSQFGAPELLAAYRFDERGAGHLVTEASAPAAPSFFNYKAQFNVASRPWRLQLTADNHYANVRRTWAGWGALVGGLLFSSLLGLLLLALTARRIMDGRRTAELAAANRSL